MTACVEFGKALPKLRRRVEHDLKRRALSRDTVLAAVVRLLDTEHIRVGNEEYAQATTRASARPPCAAAIVRRKRPQAR